LQPNGIVHTGEWVPPRKVVIRGLYTDSIHFVRYVLFRTPWGGIQIHKFVREDEERHLHNHPRKFWTLVLIGGYREEFRRLRFTCKEWREWASGTWHPFELESQHKIVKLFRVPTWTLVVVGPKRQEWGFYTDTFGRSSGFVKADDYPAYMAKEKQDASNT
jgi:hypothetical protein